MFHIEGCNVDGFSVSTPKCVRGVTASHTSLEEKGVEKIHPRFGLKNNSHLIQSHPPTFLLPWMWPWILGKMVAFEVATPLDLRFFLHVFMYPFFFLSFGIYIQSSFPPKKQLSKDLQTILSGHKSCSFFFFERNLAWAREVQIAWRKRPDPLRSGFWRFGLRDLHGLMLEGWYWMDFCFLKCQLVDFPC